MEQLELAGRIHAYLVEGELEQGTQVALADDGRPTKRVLVRPRITLKSGAPTLALLAIRDDTETRRPVAFLNWRPLKIKGTWQELRQAPGA